MLTYHFIEYWIIEIWFWEAKNIVEFVENVLKSTLVIISAILIIPIDILLSPIEIIAIIVWEILKIWKNKKRKVGE